MSLRPITPPMKIDEFSDNELREYLVENFNQTRLGPINKFTRVYHEMLTIELINAAKSQKKQIQMPPKKGFYTQDWLKLQTIKEPPATKAKKLRRTSGEASTSARSQETFNSGIKSASTPFLFYDQASGPSVSSAHRRGQDFMSSILRSLGPLQVGIPISLFVLLILIWIKSLTKED